uniref:Putative glycosyltransferase n=1 Tax=viral metagenome TaxID=1070528 RepID=A0A6M3IYQ9_9ZZZZ
MRILSIFGGTRSAANRLHFGFILKLKDKNDFFAYGPNRIDTDMFPLEFNEKIVVSDLISNFDPEVIILPDPAFLSQPRFIPLANTFKNSNVPVVLMDVDSYVRTNNKKWYLKTGIDLAIDRVPGFEYPVRSTWIPLSANEEEFFNNPLERINAVVFVGGGRYSRNKYYSVRQRAIRILEGNGLIDYLGHCGEKAYPEILRSYTIALSCSFPPLCHSPGKTFEIMASGTALLTSRIEESKILFGDEQCLFTYKEDCSDIVSLVKDILSDEDKIKEIAMNGYSAVCKKHLDKHRIVELQNILEALVSGSEIPDVWGK